MPPLTDMGYMLSDILIGVDGSHELSLFSTNNKIYWYDCFIPSKNIIIEFNSFTWHPSKEKMEESVFSSWKPPKGTYTPEEKEKKDKIKIDTAKENGYKVLVIWGEDGKEYNYNLICSFVGLK